MILFDEVIKIKIDITEQELKAISDCIYMAAREGFYAYYDGSRDQIENVLSGFYKKLGYNDNTIKDICDEQ